MGEIWIELEDNLLTDQPMVTMRGKRVPDPSRPPREAFLFTWRCRRFKHGVKRQRKLVVLSARRPEDNLEQKIVEYSCREDVVLIQPVERPLEYARYRGEPSVMESQ